MQSPARSISPGHFRVLVSTDEDEVLSTVTDDQIAGTVSGRPVSTSTLTYSEESKRHQRRVKKRLLCEYRVESAS